MSGCWGMEDGGWDAQIMGGLIPGSDQGCARRCGVAGRAEPLGKTTFRTLARRATLRLS